MSTRRWSRYNCPGASAYKMDDGLPPKAKGSTDMAMVNGCIANYAQCRRNVFAAVYNCPATFTWNSEDDIQQWTKWFHIPIGHRICRTGADKQLKIWIYYRNTVSEAGDHEVTLRAELDGGDSGEINLASLAWGWESFTIDLSNHMPEDEYITFWYNCESGNDIEVKCICAYQEQTAATPVWVDLSAANNYIATADYPNGAFALKLLRDSTEAIREQKCVKANVFTHYWYPYYKSGAYAANNDGLGRYKFIKRSGVSQVKVRCLMWKDGGDPDWNWRTEVIGHGNNVTAMGALQPTWYEHTYNFAGADIIDELELELLIDGSSNPGDICYCPGVFVWEVPAGAIAHTVPTIDNYVPGEVVNLSEHDNIRDTNDHLYNRGGCQILLSDWRVTYAGNNELYCNRVAANKMSCGESNTSTAARSIVFASTSSKRLRVRMGFNTTTGTTQVKHVNLQISDNVGVFATWDDTCERWESMTNGAYQFTESFTGDERVIACELDIPSDEWETVDVGAGGTNLNANLEVYVSAWTDNNAEYVKPNWVTVEEIALNGVEFP